jgi:hypothetical protein
VVMTDISFFTFANRPARAMKRTLYGKPAMSKHRGGGDYY